LTRDTGVYVHDGQVRWVVQGAGSQISSPSAPRWTSRSTWPTPSRPARHWTRRASGGRLARRGLVGTLGDLLALAAELITPALVSSTTSDQARRVAFPVSPDPCRGSAASSLRLGARAGIRGDKRPHWTGRATRRRPFGHFGQAAVPLGGPRGPTSLWPSSPTATSGPGPPPHGRPSPTPVLAELREARPR